MQVITITAVRLTDPENVHTAAAQTFPLAVENINTQLARATAKLLGQDTAWTHLNLPDEDVIRNTPMGNLIFKVRRHEV